MEILVGNQKTATAIFTLDDLTKAALLENFTLKDFCTSSTGQLSYTVYENGTATPKESSSIEEKLV